MSIAQHIREQKSNRMPVVMTDVYTTKTKEGGGGERPLIHVCGRSVDGEHIHVRVDGFDPYFFISRDEYSETKQEIVVEMQRRNNRIRHTEHANSVGEPIIGIETGGYVELSKIVCRLPKHVPEVREWFSRTWEADVPFINRFLIDRGITSYCTIPTGANGDIIKPNVIRPYEKDVDIKSRIVTFDIEVYVGDKGFPEYALPNQMITAISAHDSETDFYWTGVVEHSLWDADAKRQVGRFFDGDQREGVCTVYEREDKLVYDCIDLFVDAQPNILSAWNSDFDVGYLINRARELNCGNVSQLSPSDDVWQIRNEWDISRAIKGVQVWDAIKGWKKTQIHEPKSKKLDDVAVDELGYGKTPIESTDDAWKYDPLTFAEYNVRDVEATVAILRECGAIDLHENLQALTGTLFDSIQHNSRIIDNLVLREALTQEVTV